MSEYVHVLYRKQHCSKIMAGPWVWANQDPTNKWLTLWASTTALMVCSDSFKERGDLAMWYHPYFKAIVESDLHSDPILSMRYCSVALHRRLRCMEKQIKIWPTGVERCPKKKYYTLLREIIDEPYINSTPTYDYFCLNKNNPFVWMINGMSSLQQWIALWEGCTTNTTRVYECKVSIANRFFSPNNTTFLLFRYHKTGVEVYLQWRRNPEHANKPDKQGNWTISPWFTRRWLGLWGSDGRLRFTCHISICTPSSTVRHISVIFHFPT